MLLRIVCVTVQRKKNEVKTFVRMRRGVNRRTRAFTNTLMRRKVLKAVRWRPRREIMKTYFLTRCRKSLNINLYLTYAPRFRAVLNKINKATNTTLVRGNQTKLQLSILLR